MRKIINLSIEIFCHKGSIVNGSKSILSYINWIIKWKFLLRFKKGKKALYYSNIVYELYNDGYLFFDQFVSIFNNNIHILWRNDFINIELI